MAFSANGNWTLYQSNGPVVAFNMAQQPDGQFVGTGSYDGTNGTVEGGVVQGDTIFFIVDWTNGARGRYNGSLGPDRRLSGYTFDLNNPSSQATWFTTTSF